MPDVITAMEELTADQTTVEATLTSLYEEYQNKMNEFQQSGESMNDVIKQNKIKEIQDLELTIQQYQQKNKLDFNKKSKKCFK